VCCPHTHLLLISASSVGSFADVFVGKYRDEDVAVKIIRTQVPLVPELLKGFYKEVSSSSFSAHPLTSSAVLLKVTLSFSNRHQFLLTCHGACIDQRAQPPMYALVTDLCERTLKQAIIDSGVNQTRMRTAQ
jgi:hypothetical protein